ncbi:MAG: DUF2341 domain-containing protein, partial [Candidatus Omnitrophica bacterium]|nr:DUF2341 domain-containing protein [Candidatus Omnitrophota bacterium]
MGGDWINNGTFTQDTSTVTLNGAGAQSIGGGANTTFYNLYLDDTGARTITIADTAASGLAVEVTNIFTWDSATPANAANIQIGTGAYTATLKLTNTTGANSSILIPTGKSLTMVGASAIELKGDWTNNGTFTPGASTITFNDNSGTQTIGGASDTTFCNLTLSSTGTRQFADTTNTGKIFEVTNQFTWNDGGMIIGNSTGSTTAIFRNTSTTPGEANVTIPANDNLTVRSGSTLWIGGAYSAGTGIYINSGFTLTATNSATIICANDWINNGTFTQGTSTVTLNGTAAQSIGGSADTTFYSLYIDDTATRTITIADTAASGLVIEVTNYFYWQGTTNAANIQIGAGAYIATLKLTSATVSYSSVVIPTGKSLTMIGASAIELKGNWTNNGTFTQGSSTITSNGTAAQIIGGTADTTFNNLTFSTAQTSRTIANGKTITVDGVFTWTAGNFNIGYTTAATLTLAGSITIPATYTLTAEPLSSINVGGDWINNGTFTQDTSTVTFNGAGTSNITGATTFYNLTCVTPSKTLRFKGGEIFTISNTLNLNGGDAGTRIVLNNQSGDGAVQFTLKITTAGQTVSYLDISNSNVDDTGASITADSSLNTANNDDAGPDSYWIFSTSAISISGDVYSNRGIALIGAGVNIVIVVNGALQDNMDTTGTGQYSFSGIIVSAGDAILVYINDYATDGNTLTMASAADITDLDIYGATLIARHETAGPITNATLNTAKGSLTDADIIYSVASSNLTITGANDLLIWTGDTYAPGGNITIPGGFINNGTFTPGTHTVTLTATDTDNIITSNSSSFTNLTINGSGGVWTLQDAMDVDTALTITAGTLDLNGSGLDLTGAAFSNDGTLKLIGSETVTIPTFDSDSGTVEYYGTGTYATGLAAGDNYYNLTFSGAGAYTLDAALDVNNNLTFATSTSNVTYGGTLFETREIITIESDYVDDNLTNFPVLFSVTDTDLIGNVMSGSNYTIKFTNSSGTELPYEVEYYNNATGQLVAWVKADSLSSTADTNLYFYYGSSGTSSTEDATAVWDSDYKGVWHMDNDGVDSSGNGHTAAPQYTASYTTAAKIGSYAGLLDSSYDYFNVPHHSDFNIYNLTTEGWIYPTSFNYGGGIVTKYATGSGGGWYASEGASSPYNKLRFTFRSTDGGYYAIESSNTLVQNDWNHVATTYDSSYMRVYLNGIETSSNYIGKSIQQTSTAVRIGLLSPGAGVYYLFRGRIDEPRISSTARSEGWIATSYNNQDSPSTFHSTGSEASSASI